MSGSAKVYLLDTNILIYYFNGEPAVETIVNQILDGSSVGYYCPLTWVELLCYPDLSESEIQRMKAFLRALTAVDLTEPVLDQAAELRRTDRIPLADALIAACALQIGCCLVSRNVRDFNRIANLVVFNSFSEG
jgi:predicted nucleic acid-binding protein